jgi:hypothetical protein
LSDKYDLHVQMYSRMILAKKNLGSCNRGFFGGDDESVEKAAKKCGISVKALIEDADAYLGNYIDDSR